MRRLLCCLCLFIFAVNLAAKDPDPKRWEGAIAKFEKDDADNPPAKGGVVFTGSSSIALWKDVDKHFPQHKVLNRGFGGSMLPDVNYFVERIVVKHQPKTVVLFCGGNDLNAGHSPKQVLGDFQTFYRTIQGKSPETRVIYLSIHLPPSRVKQAARIDEANTLIAAECKANPKLAYLNIHDLMLGKDGQPNPDLYRDSLHPNAKAYELWAERLRPALK